MQKKLIFIFGLILFLGLGLFLTNQVQAKEIANFKGDNLGQIEIAVLREGAKGGWPVLVDDHLRVTGFFYPDQGIVTGNSGGDPVVFGDHVRVDGYLFVNQGIVKGVSGGDPVIIGDHLRVDGEISRPFGPVIVKDDLEVTGKITVKTLKVTEKLELASILDVSKADIVGAEAKSIASYWGAFWATPVTPGVQETYYLTPWGDRHDSESCFPIVSEGRIVKMLGHVATGPGGGMTDTITVRKDGSNTSMAISFSGSGSSDAQNTNAFSVSAGDCLSMRYNEDSSGNSVLTGLVVALEIETDVE